MADEDEHAIHWQHAIPLRLDVMQPDLLHRAVAFDGGHHRIPDVADLLVGCGALLERRAGPQLIAAVDDRYPVGELGQEQPLFQRAVATANDDDILAPEEEAVACRAVADTAAFKIGQSRHGGLLSGQAGGDDQGLGLQLTGGCLNAIILHEQQACDLLGQDFNTQPAGLGFTVSQKSGGLDGFWKAEVVFNQVSRGQCAGIATDHEDGQTRTYGIDSGR